ncbi:uncharacterized protein LOC115400936 isoform X1 [Salarias fasciatus]|uniref:uncharacterized protein LOC115400936 isoform X1 n=1 Tax=Salarias fasciatus TaxID=181472 RepID=UPI001176C0F2|nr:uncharacterized protein LOC115400936 isoform X1 [Salarias fasciatus]
MRTLWTLAFAALFVAHETAWGASTSSKDCCNRENQCHPGAGLSCCGTQTYNPEKATCCTVEQGNKLKVNITQGLNEAVSSCCGLTAYDEQDVNKLCCGPGDNKTLLTRTSEHHLCCGQNQYNSQTECCCETKKGDLKIKSPDLKCDVDNKNCDCQPHASDAKCCDHNLYYKDKQLCCGKHGEKKLFNRTSEYHKCCGPELFDNRIQQCHDYGSKLGLKVVNCSDCDCPSKASDAEYCDHDLYYKDKQLCCGKHGEKKLFNRTSEYHKCCGPELFDNRTQQCHDYGSKLGLKVVNCSGEEQKKPEASCSEPNRSACGADCYNPDTHGCCQRDPRRRAASRCCASDSRDVEATVFDLRTHVCWDGCLSEKTKRTNQLNGSRGCQGTEVRHPHDAEICCDGEIHPKGTSARCCGYEAFNITDPLKKCCGKTLHNLTAADAALVQCCGASLQNKLNQVCCSGEEQEKVYTSKPGFRCCGHLYYNASEQQCCAGRPVSRSGQSHSEGNEDWQLLSVNSLTETHLCHKMYTGTLKSVSPCGIVFIRVLKIHGTNASVTPLSHYVLDPPGGCGLPQLTPGKQYLFDEHHVFVDFNHDDVHHSLFSIFSKCCVNA